MNADAWKLVTDLANTKIEEGVRQREEALMREFISKVVEQFNLEPGHEKVLWSIAKECSGDVTPMSRIPRCIFKGTRNGQCGAYPADGKWCCSQHFMHEPKENPVIFAKLQVRAVDADAQTSRSSSQVNPLQIIIPKYPGQFKE